MGLRMFEGWYGRVLHGLPMEGGIKRAETVADARPVFIHVGMRKNVSEVAGFCVQLCSAGEEEGAPIVVKSAVIAARISDIGNCCKVEGNSFVGASLNLRTVTARCCVVSFAYNAGVAKVNAKAAKAAILFTYILFYHESCLMRVRGLQRFRQRLRSCAH